ncbi:DUF1788 domain-containing protein [Endozoicomonas euniceicola]|uniref:DUF1788 domain-containing protein n=1 Tax=Endozoicomonas euniceicola TaxID=1234143 RepID=A0ABY6GRU7_9GAMM|nr:DUF1788 domain-containing protein [Endozoicomonas euniceicola]UYM15475.1 DUF1788 domain-containing protein [Endozoicomonas euniceicola]
MKQPAKQLQNRLNLVQERIESTEFLNNEGLGNELGFWVFDYPPEFELVVRQHTEEIMKRLHKRGYRFAVVNLFEIMIDMIEARNLLDKAFLKEKHKGATGLKSALKAPLDQKRVADYLTSKINPEQQQFVILTGLGSTWPMLRGHELLNALHAKMGATPLVLFYPGTYSGLDIKLFNLIKSHNYYRAFKLVPEDGSAPAAS